MTSAPDTLPDELRTALLAYVLDGDAAAGADLARRVAAVDGAESYLLLVAAELPRFFAVPEGTAAAPLAAADQRATALLDEVEAIQLARLTDEREVRPASEDGADAATGGAIVVSLAAHRSRRRRALTVAVALAAAAVILFVARPREPARSPAEGQQLAAELAPTLQPLGAAGAGLEPYALGYRNGLVLWLAGDDVPTDARDAARAAALTLLTAGEGRDEAGLTRLLATLAGDPCRVYPAGPPRDECGVGVDLLAVRAALAGAPSDPDRWATAAQSSGARRVLALAADRLPDHAAALATARAASDGRQAPPGAIAAWDALIRALLGL